LRQLRKLRHRTHTRFPLLCQDWGVGGRYPDEGIPMSRFDVSFLDKTVTGRP
jgi:hypothetical protein